MINKPVVLLLTIALTPSLNIVAQQQKNEEEKECIVDKIITESNGSVSIEMPENIRALMEPYKPQANRTTSRRGSYKTTGYRIQVFSDGRHQQTLEARAGARGRTILSKFPKYRGQIYSFSKSPNWYTRVGNFETLAEANAALAELKRAFPSFAGEMRTVRCEIVIRK